VNFDISLKKRSRLITTTTKDVLNYPVDFWLVDFGAVQTPWDRAAVGWSHFNIEQWLSDDIGGYQEFVIQVRPHFLFDSR